jgi:CPA2 family monovalent cation:H+ antiporter-2
MTESIHDYSRLFIELGGVAVGLAILARIASRIRLSPISLFLLAGEDLMMAIFLPLIAVLLAGGGPTRILISVGVACTVVLLVLFIATRYGHLLSNSIANQSDEVVLLTVFGTVLLVAGIAQRLQVSAAIGAFLVGIAVSGPITEQSHRLLTPLRDLFAATFFFFFGLEIDPRSLPPVLLVTVALAVVSVLSKVLTGYWATAGKGLDRPSRLRAGFTLTARGEFSIVIAGLGIAVEPRLGSLSAAYVLLMAISGPLLARAIR